VPPELTCVRLAKPPVNIRSIPPLSTVPMVVPPGSTLSVPPLKTTHPAEGEPEKTPEVWPLPTVVMALSCDQHLSGGKWVAIKVRHQCRMSRELLSKAGERPNFAVRPRLQGIELAKICQ
jgi:hypothetical protein